MLDHKLKKAKVKVYNYEECRTVYREEKIVNKKAIMAAHICAGPPHISEVKIQTKFLLP